MTTSTFVFEALLFLDLDEGAISIKKDDSQVRIKASYFSDIRSTTHGICVLIEGTNSCVETTKCLARGCFFLPSEASQIKGYFCYNVCKSATLNSTNIAFCSPYKHTSQDRRMTVHIYSRKDSIISGINISNCEAKYQILSNHAKEALVTGSTIADCNIEYELFIVTLGAQQWTRVNIISCTTGNRLFCAVNCNFVIHECSFSGVSGKIDTENSNITVTKSYKSSSCSITGGSRVTFDWSGKNFENKHESPRQLVEPLLERLKKDTEKTKCGQLAIVIFGIVI